MYAECSHWANWIRAFHTQISLFLFGLLNLHYLSLSSLSCCRMHYAATWQLSQSTRQISTKNICSNSLAEKRSLTRCPELVGKVFMVKLGMITLVSEMRQNTGTDVKQSTPQITSQGNHSLWQNPWSIRQLFWSTSKFHICASAVKMTLPNWSGAKQMRIIKLALNAPYWKGQQS